MADLTHLLGGRNYALCIQEPRCEFTIVPRRPHRDRDRTVDRLPLLGESQPDLQRFLDSQLIDSVLIDPSRETVDRGLKRRSTGWHVCSLSEALTTKA